MLRHSMVWTLPSEVSKSLPGLVESLTRAQVNSRMAFRIEVVFPTE